MTRNITFAFQDVLPPSAADHLASCLLASEIEQRGLDWMVEEYEFMVSNGLAGTMALMGPSGYAGNPLGLMAEWSRRSCPRRWTWCAGLLADPSRTDGGETTVEYGSSQRHVAAWEYGLPPEVAGLWGLDEEAERALSRVAVSKPESALEALKHVADAHRAGIHY